MLSRHCKHTKHWPLCCLWRQCMLAQAVHVLGSSRGGRSFLVGYGRRWPSRPQHHLSSCPDSGPCNVLTGLLAPGPNPHELTGERAACCCDAAVPMLLRARILHAPPCVPAAGGIAVRALRSTPTPPPAQTGALVSGPGEDDGFDDDRTLTSQSGIGLHHNVALGGLLGGLLGRRVTPGQCAAGRGAYQLLAENVLP